MRVCLIEDDEIMGESLVDRFRLEGIDVEWFREGKTAAARLSRQAFSLVLTDIRLPDTTGDELFRQLIRKVTDLPPVIFITAYGSVDRAVELLKLGAADYVCKPFDIEEMLQKMIRAERPMSVSSPLALLDAAGSPGMARLRSLLPKFARTRDTVLVTGESGVGKEFVAKILHDLDPAHRAEPFVAINCAALPDSLVESELFGHERGAFTGAQKLKRGAFELAGQGTLFLDEIGDLAAGAQVKLLRALQQPVIRRLGGERDVPVNCRVVAATNRPIFEQVSAGQFREDLFYRINPLHLRVPPLRERRDEILPLARAFLNASNKRNGGSTKALSAAAEAALIAHDWPGNVRELKSVVERAHLIAGHRLIERTHLFDEGGGLEIDTFEEPPSNLAGYLGQQERAFLVETLGRHGWRIIETATALGISRKALWEKMRRYAINEPPLDDRPFSGR